MNVPFIIGETDRRCQHQILGCIYFSFFSRITKKEREKGGTNTRTHTHTQEKQGGVLHGKRSGWSRVNIRAKHTNLKVCIYSNNISTPKYTIFKEKYIERGKIIHTHKNHHHHLLFIFFFFGVWAAGTHGHFEFLFCFKKIFFLYCVGGGRFFFVGSDCVVSVNG